MTHPQDIQIKALKEILNKLGILLDNENYDQETYLKEYASNIDRDDFDKELHNEILVEHRAIAGRYNRILKLIESEISTAITEAENTKI